MTYLYVKTSSAKQYSIELMAMAPIPPFLIKVETATSRDPQSTTHKRLSANCDKCHHLTEPHHIYSRPSTDRAAYMTPTQQ